MSISNMVSASGSLLYNKLDLLLEVARFGDFTQAEKAEFTKVNEHFSDKQSVKDCLL